MSSQAHVAAARSGAGLGRVRAAIIGLACLGLAAVPASAATIFVDADAPLGGDGTSWASAYRFLQDAIFSSAPGDAIWVADGTYHPDEDEGGNVFDNDRTATFTLDFGLTLLGGFVGGEATADERDVDGNPPAILSGAIGNKTDEDNSYHVTTGTNAGAPATIDGFRIEEGYAGNILAGAPDPRAAAVGPTFLVGGGMTLIDADTVVVRCLFRFNFAEVDGGAVSVSGGAPLFQHCRFFANTADEDGGGVNTMNSAEPTFEDCEFEDNVADDGGGMFHDDGLLTLIRCTFFDNEAGEGGGLYNDDNDTVLEDCVFDTNVADCGGGLYCDNSASITGCLFRNNTAGNLGGGVYTDGDLFATRCNFLANHARNGGGLYIEDETYLTNCRLVGNTATEGERIKGGGGHGGGLFSACTDPFLVNCLVSGNEADNDGGGVYYLESFGAFCDSTFTQNVAGGAGGALFGIDGAQAPFSNCILWGDVAAEGPEVFIGDLLLGNTMISFQNCDVQGSGGSANWDPAFGDDLGGNIDANPLFLDANGPDNIPGTLDDDVRLPINSPCIDTGNNDLLPDDMADLDDDDETEETLPLDLLDMPRVATRSGAGLGGPIVDIGAIELQLGPPPPPGERAHPGWNSIDQQIVLTSNQPACWSAATGQGTVTLAPFGVLDAGDPPGRPANDGTGDRVLRGFIYAFAVDQDGEEIRWNHLFGNGTVINYGGRYGWEYNSWNHQVVSGVPEGTAPDAVPGRLNLDGVEYSSAFDRLRLNFAASGSDVFGGGGVQITNELDVTLHPESADFRQEGDGPLTTKASYLVWNENEVEFSGMHRCITCWDQQIGELYAGFGVPNHFLRTTLQTDCGTARIDGLASQLCDLDFDPGNNDTFPFPPGPGDPVDPRDIVSVDAALIGVASRLLRIDSGMTNAASAYDLVGTGTEAASILYDPSGGSQEAQGGPVRPNGFGAERTRPTRPRTADLNHGRGDAINVPAALSGPIMQDRVSATEKGSLVLFSAVELRWSGVAPYDLLQDTFLSLTNDGLGDVRVQLYFVNGDPPLPATP